MLLICGGVRRSSHLFGLRVGQRFGVRGRPALSRCADLSGDEMIDWVLVPRSCCGRSVYGGRPACGRWRREHCGSGPQGHRSDHGRAHGIGQAAASTSCVLLRGPGGASASSPSSRRMWWARGGRVCARRRGRRGCGRFAWRPAGSRRGRVRSGGRRTARPRITPSATVLVLGGRGGRWRVCGRIARR
jgi:hypothetical protein